eukprot:3867084-Rhodomonas_salina.1
MPAIWFERSQLWRNLSAVPQHLAAIPVPQVGGESERLRDDIRLAQKALVAVADIQNPDMSEMTKTVGARSWGGLGPAQNRAESNFICQTATAQTSWKRLGPAYLSSMVRAETSQRPMSVCIGENAASHPPREQDHCQEWGFSQEKRPDRW